MEWKISSMGSRVNSLGHKAYLRSSPTSDLFGDAAATDLASARSDKMDAEGQEPDSINSRPSMHEARMMTVA
jgi:hypothetical protein